MKHELIFHYKVHFKRECYINDSIPFVLSFTENFVTFLCNMLFLHFSGFERNRYSSNAFKKVFKFLYDHFFILIMLCKHISV